MSGVVDTPVANPVPGAGGGIASPAPATAAPGLQHSLDAGPIAPAATPEPPAPVAPAQPTPEPEPAPYRLPGQYEPVGDETTWIRQQYSQTLSELAAARQRIEEIELSGLDEGERQTEVMRRQMAQFEEQRRNFEAQQAMNEFRNYATQFVPLTGQQVNLAQYQDPVQMLHHGVITPMATRLQALERENQALRAAATQPASAPPVTTAAGGNPGRRTWRDMSDAEIEAHQRRVQLGLAQMSEIY